MGSGHKTTLGKLSINMCSVELPARSIPSMNNLIKWLTVASINMGLPENHQLV